MTLKFSNFIIGGILIGVFVAIFMLAMSDVASKNTGVSFNNATMSKYQKLTEMQSQVDSLRKNESELGRSGGVLDILGDWFEQGYNTLRASKLAFETFETMGNDAGEDLGLSSVSKYLFIGIGAILSVIVVFIIISTLTKREQ